MSDAADRSSRQPFLQGGGDLGALIRTVDWVSHPFGDPANWPQPLRSALSICLNSSFPTAIYWGPELRLLYNDAWSQIPAERHPWALGRAGAEVWADIWGVVGPQFAQVLKTGQGISTFDQMLPMQREGRTEETYWNYSFTPIFDEDGRVAGIFNQGHETTGRVLVERRQAFWLALEDRLRRLDEPGAIMAAAVELLGRHLGANRVGYSEVQSDGVTVVLHSCFADGVEPLKGAYRLDSFGPDDIARQRRGLTQWSDDLTLDPGHDPQVWAAIETRAYASVPLVRNGCLTASLYVNFRAPHRWREEEIALIEEVAARTWSAVERARAEAARHLSESRFRGVFDSGIAGFTLFDANTGETLAVNDRFLAMTGHSRADFEEGRWDWREFTVAEHLDKDERAIREARERGFWTTYEKEYRRRDGSMFPVRIASAPLPGEAGRVVVSIEDISAQRAADAALHESEARLRFLSELDEGLRAANDAPGAMARAAELLAKRLGASRCAYADVDTDEDNDRFVIRNDWTAPGLPSSAGTYSLDLFGSRAAADMRDGRTLVIRDVASELAPSDGRGTFQAIAIDAIVCCPLVREGRLVAMMAVHQNVPRDWRADEISLVEATVERCWAHVERIGSEARLRESEALARSRADEIASIYNATPVGLCVFDRELRYVRINERLAEINGAPASDHIGRTAQEMVPDLFDQAIEVTGRVLAGEAVHGVEFVGVTPAQPGMVRTWRCSWLPLRDAAGDIIGITVSAEEITEAKRAEAALRELNETLERRVADAIAERDRIFQLSDELFAAADFDGYLKAINPAWSRLLGYREADLLVRPFADLTHPADQATVAAAIAALRRGERLVRFEDRLIDAAGRNVWIVWTAVPDGDRFYAYGRDITAEKARQAELEAAQEALRQSQKMEAMGQLTGGVAHDFNNLLSPIFASLDMLQRKGLGGEREQRMIAGALQSAERAKVLVQRLLAFARRQPLQPVAVDVAGLIIGMGELVASTTGPQIRVVVEADDSLPAARADPNQLEMAVLNLAVNARDAMPEGGTLRISARSESIEGAHRSKLRPGAYVCLSVADTGSGMDEATLARAVEPFFSTKGVGKGTGLGLSMVHGLASQLGGALTIQSRAGLGTNVELWLPQTAAAPEGAATSAETPRVAARGTVLLVDDEDLVRLATTDMLVELGYAVVEAKSGEEALRLINQGHSFDLLVTDHLMPGLSGTDLARLVRSARPGVPVLLVSGYAESEGIEPGLPRLAKPFRNDELASSVAQLWPPGEKTVDA